MDNSLLDLLDRVGEAVLFLQLLDGRLAVLNEGGSVDTLAVMGLLVLFHDFIELVLAFVSLDLVHILGEVDDKFAMFGNACFHG